MNHDSSKKHWETIYSEKSPLEVSWYQSRPTHSLKIIQELSNTQSSIIDVGGGASVLVDHLLKLGYTNLTVLDISRHALAHAQQRLGDQAGKVQWLEENITQFRAPQCYDIWHDRAVFHFLTDPESRALYIESLKIGTKLGSYAMIATFAKDGPTKCSGLDIVQYDAESIQKEFAENFTLLDTQAETHLTPGGKEQKFLYFVLRRK